MNHFERMTQILATADSGFCMRNKDNQREVEVTRSTCLRYLCRECGKTVCRMSNETAAYQFLKGEIL